MIYVKEIVLNENMNSNYQSVVGFRCGADKLFFDLLVDSASMQVFFKKLNFEDFEINVKFICIDDQFQQKINDYGFFKLSGTFLHAYNMQHTSLSLEAGINQSQWLKLKSDFLMLRDEKMNFNFEKINFIKLIKDDTSTLMEYDVEVLIDGYQIVKTLKFKSLN